LAQCHIPGEAAQTDFTHASELAVTIRGELFEHLLCVFTLPYSNWRWSTVCLSESIASIRKGIQRALFQLGRAPKYHQTDNSTAATHRIPAGNTAFAEGSTKRPFNEEYLAIMRHFGMKPRTTEVGEKQQNGDVEASNRATKRQLEQALLLRGHRDFDSVDEWQSFINDVQRKHNRRQGARVAEDIEAMRELNVEKLAEYVEMDVRVSEWSTIRVKQCGYSVPSRLIGERVQVRIFEDKIEVRFATKLQLECERLRGKNRRRIDYRHIIWSLVRKPGGFARYVYREELFPSIIFRRAYDAIQAAKSGLQGDVEYLRILHLAASTLESDVEVALGVLLDANERIVADTVKALVNEPQSAIQTQILTPLPVDLRAYDALLGA
jgi:hypothetical protein